jgi:hypothetical protein
MCIVDILIQKPGLIIPHDFVPQFSEMSYRDNPAKAFYVAQTRVKFGNQNFRIHISAPYKPLSALFSHHRPILIVTINIIMMVTSPVKCFYRLFFVAAAARPYYIGVAMKNHELLKTGRKPAPGELALVQGFVNTLNTLDIERECDDLHSPGALKAWMVRHGLLDSAVSINEDDFKEWITFREALQALLGKNNGGKLGRDVIRYLNRLLIAWRRDLTLKSVLARTAPPCCVRP